MIYVHIPFCRSKCAYCAFYSIADNSLIDNYIAALISEMRARSGAFAGRAVESVYIGGGTPSLLSSHNVDAIFEALHRYFVIDPQAEITFELNPEDAEPAYLRRLLAVGVNRLSVGVQSTNDDVLRFMRRRHDFKTAQKAVLTAAAAGFDNIGIDMIYGIAGVPCQQWQQQLDIALQLPVTHLSAYHLEVEPQTLLYRKVQTNEYHVVSDDESFLQYKALIHSALQHGFEQYEISNFARRGRTSRHNSGYWRRSDYLGFGASAHSLLGCCRSRNVADVGRYIRLVGTSSPPSESELLSPTDVLNETIMLSLRTTAGLNLSAFSDNFGRPACHRLLQKLATVNPANYVLCDQSLRLTVSGMFVSDDIISTLFD